MPEYTGANLSVVFGAQTMSGNQRTFTTTHGAGLADASAGADVARSHLKTLENGTASMEVLADDATEVALWAAVKPGTTGNLVWGERGIAAGMPRHTVPAIVSSRKRDAP